MARKKKIAAVDTIKPSKKVNKPVMPVKKSSSIDLDITINKSYVIDNPLKELNTTVTIQLDSEHIDNTIKIVKKEYSGITATSKGTNIVIFTGKHFLNKDTKLTEGNLTIRISEI